MVVLSDTAVPRLPARLPPGSTPCSLRGHPGHTHLRVVPLAAPGLHRPVPCRGGPTLALFPITTEHYSSPAWTTVQRPPSPSSLLSRGAHKLPVFSLPRSALSLLGRHCLPVSLTADLGAPKGLGSKGPAWGASGLRSRKQM